MGNEEQTGEEIAVKEMLQALKFLQSVPSSRENSLAITNLEQAMMWCNKDRTIKGQLTPNDTHVEAKTPETVETVADVVPPVGVEPTQPSEQVVVETPVV
jgi:hypothetical protein